MYPAHPHALRRRLRTLIALVAALPLVASLAACDTGGKPARPADQRPDAEQVLRVMASSGAGSGGVGWLDPLYIGSGYGDAEFEAAYLIYPKLVALDEQQRPVPWDATRWDVGSDGLTYTLHLRAGMHWADGAPIDAQTFAFSINRSLSPCAYEAAYLPHTLRMLRSAEAFSAEQCPDKAPVGALATLIGSGPDAAISVPDPLTLVLRLERPTAAFLTLLAQPDAWAVPQRLVEARPALAEHGGQGGETVLPPQAEDTWTNHLLDNGQFGGDLFTLRTVAREDDPDSVRYGTLTLARNESFWGAKPVLRSIEYTIWTYSPDAWEAFAGGQGNVGYPDVSLGRGTRVEWYPDLFAREAAARTLPGFAEVPQPYALAYVPNWRAAPFDDARVRQAFDLALDRNTLLDDPMRGILTPTRHLLLAGSIGYNPALRDPAGRSGDAALGADLTSARRLAQAYADDRCGGQFSGCPAVKVTVYHFYHRDEKTRLDDQFAARAVAQWQVAFPGWPVTSAIWQYFDASQTYSPIPQLTLRDRWESYPWPGEQLARIAPQDGTANQVAPRTEQTTCDIPAATAALHDGDRALDTSTALARYQAAEQAAVEQACWIPLFQSRLQYATRGVKGYTVTPLGVPSLMSYQTMYLTR